jgi:DNA (cytosine-5)-methyltransferase 1
MRDPKNNLYLRIIRAVEVIGPKAVVIENVPNVRHDSGGVVARASRRLDQLGYHVVEIIVAAVRIGVPQLRTRHVLVAVRNASSISIEAFRPYEMKEARTLRWAIDDLVAEGSADLFTSSSHLSAENAKRARYLLQSKKYDLPNRLRPPCHRDKPSHSYKSMYGRLSWDQPAQTITTGFGSPGQGRYLHPGRPRTITPHEAARLQFFPDWFDFSKATSRTTLSECIGNAVPPKIVFCVGQAVLSIAGRSTEEPLSPLAG